MSPLWLLLLLLLGCALVPVPDRWRKDPSGPSLPVPTATATRTPRETPTAAPTATPKPVLEAPRRVCAGEPFAVEILGLPYAHGTALVADGKWQLGLFGKAPAGHAALYAVILRNEGKRVLSAETARGTLKAPVEVLPAGACDKA